MPETALVDRVRIFSRDGNELAQIGCAADRSWAVGLMGRASMTLSSRQTSYVNDDILRYGNLVLIENSRLPSWVGVIDTPREWSARQVTINAFTPEKIFSYRRGEAEQKLSGSAGAIFEKLISKINAEELTALKAGNVWRGGSQREETLGFNTLDNNLRQLQERSKEEYIWRPQIEAGKLVIFADWKERLGEETPLELYESPQGGNIEVESVNEDGVIVNDLLGYGDGITWASRPISRLRETTSAGRYGLRQAGKNYPGVSQQGTITDNNRQAITPEPKIIFSLSALNVEDTLDYISLGNTVTVKLASIGFTGDSQGMTRKARIMGMSYAPLSGQKVKLVLNEVK